MADYVRLNAILKQIVAVCLLAALGTGASPAAAEAADKTVTIIGSSRIYNDVTNARDAAITEGLLSAVEMVTLEMVPQENLKAEFEAISTGIHENRQEVIQGYQVLEETQTGRYYLMLIQATVSEDKIASMLQDMGISLSPEGLPRILFLVAEKQAGAFSFDYWWQDSPPALKQRAALQSIKEVFRKQGYPVVDSPELSSLEAPKPDLPGDMELSATLSDEEAVILGRRANADVVVFGLARAKESPNKMGGGIKTFKADLALTALNVSTGEVITRVEQTGKAANRDIRRGSRSALAEAGLQGGKIIASRISAAWRQQARQADTLEIHVKGEGNILQELVRLRQALRSIEGITGLQTRGRSRNEALMNIQYEGSARRLADKIILTSFKGFGVDIYELTDNRISIRLIAEDQPITESDLH